MYDKIAHYYDLTHADLTEDVDYILKLIGETAASAGSAQAVSILELGCGSGRLLLPLARAGHTVTGIDNATAMLARAQERLIAEPVTVQQRVTLLEADMTQFNIAANRFDWAILPYNTFMHLDPNQMSMALRKIAGSLAENGRLLIDLINPIAMASTPNDRLLTLENSLPTPKPATSSSSNPAATSMKRPKPSTSPGSTTPPRQRADPSTVPSPKLITITSTLTSSNSSCKKPVCTSSP